MVDIQTIILTVFAVAGSVFGYFYRRKYEEDREFRREMHERTHNLDVKLERNCTITQRMGDDVKLIKDHLFGKT